jgi:signal transduction histidine kinase
VCVYNKYSFSGRTETRSSQAISETYLGANRLSHSAESAVDVSPAESSNVSILREIPSAFASLLSRPSIRYTSALALTAIALLGRWLLVPVLGDHVPFALVYGAVVLSSIYLGLRPAIASSVMGIVCVRLFFAPHVFKISSVRELSETLTYIGGCVLITAAVEATRHSQNKLKAANRELEAQANQLRTLNEQLETRVEERTARLKQAEQSALQLGAQVLRSQDNERRRIARDLHDSIGQAVAILNMNLGALRRSQNLSEAELAIVADSKATASEVADQVRNISHLLHPPLLEELGLPPALRWYTREFAKRSGIATRLDLSEQFCRLSEDCEIAIFRVLQEALTNIHRHSRSRCADVRVTWSPNEVCLQVADRGVGIPLSAQRAFAAGGAMGVGLRGMRERVSQLGGRLELTSSHQGTIVTAIFPISAGTLQQPVKQGVCDLVSVHN